MATNTRNNKTGNISIVVSISLVLFILGIIGLLVLNTYKLSNYVKENIGVSVFLKDSVNVADVNNFKKILDASTYVKSATLISKEQAAKDLQKELGGEQFISFLGFNPLNDLIDLRLNASYANNDSIAKIEKMLVSQSVVKEVYYQKNLISLVSTNTRKISIVLFGFTILLLIICVALINNTIRLSIYSKRFLIKTMQLVGATSQFIRKPFIVKSLMNGVLGATFATLLLLAFVSYIYNQLEGVFTIEDIDTLLLLIPILFIIGIIISSISTLLSVKKYLQLNIDKLYN